MPLTSHLGFALQGFSLQGPDKGLRVSKGFRRRFLKALGCFRMAGWFWNMQLNVG